MVIRVGGGAEEGQELCLFFVFLLFLFAICFLYYDLFTLFVVVLVWRFGCLVPKKTFFLVSCQDRFFPESYQCLQSYKITKCTLSTPDVVSK